MKIRVLLADDHAILREGLRLLLSATPDITVVGEAGDGRNTVHLALELRPDVVVMDLAMPEMNGVEATRLLREKCPATRVVILSMHSSTEHVFRAFQAGASGYVLKESASAEVEAAVRAVHGGRRYFSLAFTVEFRAALSVAGRDSPIDRLSVRELQVLQLVVEGYSSSEIASSVHLSPKTVETYRGRLMKKLGVDSVPALVKFAVDHGLTA